MTSSTRNIATYQIVWRGIAIEIEYEAHWLGADKIGGLQVAHLQVWSVEPERAALPITETGYRSHFVDRGAVANAGGPVEYVRLWLEADARSKTWQSRELAQRQLTLF